MDPIFQDVVVTVIASAAALVLIQRVRGVVTSSRKSASCDNCPTCEPRPPVSSSVLERESKDATP